MKRDASVSNAALMARRRAAIARGVGQVHEIFVDHARDCELWDVEGRRYIDFAGGIAVLNTGHCHPKVVAAVEVQLRRLTHTCFQLLAYEPYVELAERLLPLVPGDFARKAMFLSTGAEAVENAIKIARAHTRRDAVIAFGGGFHGRTNMTMALTGKVAPYKAGFGPFPPGIFHAQFPNALHGISADQALASVEHILKCDAAPEEVAALIIEPVQGEGGFYVAPTELMVALRKICDQHGILLISDEVQAGFARTGKMFGIEHTGVEPDLIAIAKSLAGGFPLSGVIGKAAVMDSAEPGGLGGTYGGNPVACAAALAVLDVMAEEKLLDRANSIGTRIKAKLEKMARQNDLMPIAAVRGPGAMIGFEIVKERGGFDPDPEATKLLTTKALELGLIVLSCGVYGNVIRILVPLTASDKVIDEGMNLLEQAMKTAA